MCPGMKMAQVEFIATFAPLLANCRAEPVLKNGQTMEEARKDLLDVLQDSVDYVYSSSLMFVILC